MATIQELLHELATGRADIATVAEQFRRHTWPPPRYTPRDLAAAEANQQDDPAPVEPDSFAEVTAAWHRGQISDEQYRLLCEAAR